MSASSTDNLHDRRGRTSTAIDRFVDGRRAEPWPVERRAILTCASMPTGRGRRSGGRSGRGSRRWRSARDLVRDEVVLSARTWVVKVGTSVLTGPDGTLDPARIDHLAEQISAVMDTGRQGRPGQLRGRRRGDRPARADAPARQPPPAPGRRRGRPGVPDPRLRRGLPPPRPPRRPAPADPRGLRQPAALPEHAEHADGPVRVGRRPGHQRERHDQRRRDQVRRQRPARRDGHQPAPGPLLVILSVVDGLYRTDPGPGGRRRGRSRWSRTSTTTILGLAGDEPERAGDRRDAEQARRRPGWSPRPAARSSSPRARSPSR